MAKASFRSAVKEEHPLQVIGAINAYTARMAEATGFRALYLSGGGVAANSLGMPDLGISTMEDVLIDVRRITEVTTLPLLVDIDTGWGSAFNIARTIRSMQRAGAAAVHIEDQVGAKRCGHRPGKELVPSAEMVDRIKAAVDARTDPEFVIMARTDALAGEGIEAALDRVAAYVAAGADMIDVSSGQVRRTDFGLVAVRITTSASSQSARFPAAVKQSCASSNRPNSASRFPSRS